MMNFIVSGQPKLGHESWPPPMDDKVLSERLYEHRGAKESTRMEIKFEKVGDRLITYYHFSKLKDVTSCLSIEEMKMNPRPDHGRPGSFFVMSLRMDGYYSTDFSRIYTLLDEMYENYVKEKVLKRSKEGYLVYQIMKLEDAKEIWKEIASELEVKGWNTFLKRFKPISDDISIKGSKTTDYFSVEDAEKDIENALIQKGGVIVLSPNEMKARKERLNKPEKKLNDDSPCEEKIEKNEFASHIKSRKEDQEHASTSVNNLSKTISLSEEQGNNNETTSDVGVRFPSPSQKNDLVNRLWIPIVLIVLGLIDVWLCITLVNMKGKVNSLMEQIDTLTIQGGTSMSDLPPAQNVTDNNSGKSNVSAGIVTYNNEAEDAEITLLDLRKSDNTDASSMIKGNSYVVTAKTGRKGNRIQAKGTGKYSCDVSVDKGVNWRQEGNKCYITIYEDVTTTQIILTYAYQLGDEQKSLSKQISIK